MSTCLYCGQPAIGICNQCIKKLTTFPPTTWTSSHTSTTAFDVPKPEPVEPPEAELVAQTVMAQRLWQWIPGKGLQGMRELWESGYMKARCGKGHESPHWNDPRPDISRADPYMAALLAGLGRKSQCLCGVNAYKLTHLFDESDLMWARGQAVYATGYLECLPVLGIVELGGEVHEYERGYRAQYGQIVEGTVLTSLPVDREALKELEEKYDAPFRVESYESWKEEWEVTYGRDRSGEAEDQSTETGASQTTSRAAVNTITAGTSQTTSASLKRQFDLQRALIGQFSSGLSIRKRTRWERFKGWWWINWPLVGAISCALLGFSLVALS